MLKNIRRMIRKFFYNKERFITSKNPFVSDDNFEDIFKKIKQETERLDRMTFKNTYVWIEKFRENNIDLRG